MLMATERLSSRQDARLTAVMRERGEVRRRMREGRKRKKKRRKGWGVPSGRSCSVPASPLCRVTLWLS